eukprot:8189-Pelagococcus_subviridis.AAC.1
MSSRSEGTRTRTSRRIDTPRRGAGTLKIRLIGAEVLPEVPSYDSRLRRKNTRAVHSVVHIHRDAILLCPRLYCGVAAAHAAAASSMASRTIRGSGSPFVARSAASKLAVRCATELAPRMTASPFPPSSWLCEYIHRNAADAGVNPSVPSGSAVWHAFLISSAAEKYSLFQNRSWYILLLTNRPRSLSAFASALYDACLPVRSPPARGLYAKNRTFNFRSAGNSSGSHARVTQLYIPWYALGGGIPISRHLWYTCTTSHAGKLLSPSCFHAPSSCSALSSRNVSSIGVAASGACRYNRSTAPGANASRDAVTCARSCDGSKPPSPALDVMFPPGHGFAFVAIDARASNSGCFEKISPSILSVSPPA